MGRQGSSKTNKSLLGRGHQSLTERKKKKNYCATVSSNKSQHIIRDLEVIEVTYSNSRPFYYLAGSFFSYVLALSVVATMIVCNKDCNLGNFSSPTRFGNMFVDAGDSDSVWHQSPRAAPSLCSDGYTYGYSDWNTLKSAIHEANQYSESLASSLDDIEWIIDDHGMAAPAEPPPAPEPFIICPGVTLKGSVRKGPIFIDSENIVIECDACIIDAGGTHLTFGQNAIGISIRGITFLNARSTSLTFYHHGADVSFEDCRWLNNAGLGTAGAVADLNSTSSVSFYRCEISESKQMPRVIGSFRGRHSLTIREGMHS